MSEYTKKKQLLDENKDMYISEYDKNLSYEALSQIVDAKKSYAKAAKNNNKSEMTKANNIANAVRAKYGSYTGGEFGDEYNPFTYAKTDYEDYSSKYEDELDRLYDLVSGPRNSFEYDYISDPVYLAYKSLYDKKGSLAYDRALAKNSLKTGGMQNSNAQSAAMQALSYYNSQLASLVPELYEAAYERYYKAEDDRLSRLKDSYKLIGERENRDYNRHLDKLSHEKDVRDYLGERTRDELDRIFTRTENEADREFTQAQNEADRAFTQSQNELDRAFTQSQSEAERRAELQKQKLEAQSDSQKMLYDLIRDRIDDEKWRANYNLSASRGSHPSYSGSIGTGDILSYARDIFANPDLTLADLNRLLGL